MMPRVAIAFLLLCGSVYAWKRPFLLHGRLQHGMLPPPRVEQAITVGEEQWFPQRLNHFDPLNNMTWQQRYFVNDSYWTDKAKGPVFLMLGGEGPADPIWLAVNTDMMRNAEKYGALALMIEHRYYGSSHPTESLETDNLRYLSSEQALGDIAVFHDYIVKKYQLTENNKWISFGGSYSGALSAWLRIKYPHLIAGAIASSAPVQPELNFMLYYEAVNLALLLNSKQRLPCPIAIQAANAILDDMVHDPKQLPAVESLFNTSLQGMNDIMNLASTMAGYFAGVVQYSGDNRAFEGVTNTVTIDDLCGIMINESIGDQLDRYAAVNAMFLKMEGLESLDVSYQEYVEFMKNTSWTSPAAEGARQWFYQMCTEFGYFQTSDGGYQPFGDMFPLNFSVQQCQDIFGPKFDQSAIEEGIKWTEMNYGGRDVNNNTKNIVFPNGAIDPWYPLGILQSVNMYTTAIFISGAAHCADMYPPQEEDSQDLVNAREVISHKIQSFLMKH